MGLGEVRAEDDDAGKVRDEDGDVEGMHLLQREPATAVAPAAKAARPTMER